MSLEFCIDLYDFTADWCQEFRGSFYRFNVTKLFFTCDILSALPGQFDVDNIAKLVLGIIGNANKGMITFYTNPFIGLAILQIVWMIQTSHYGNLPSGQAQSTAPTCIAKHSPYVRL